MSSNFLPRDWYHGTHETWLATKIMTFSHTKRLMEHHLITSLKILFKTSSFSVKKIYINASLYIVGQFCCGLYLLIAHMYVAKTSIMTQTTWMIYCTWTSPDAAPRLWIFINLTNMMTHDLLTYVHHILVILIVCLICIYIYMCVCVIYIYIYTNISVANELYTQ